VCVCVFVWCGVVWFGVKRGFGCLWGCRTSNRELAQLLVQVTGCLRNLCLTKRQLKPFWMCDAVPALLSLLEPFKLHSELMLNICRIMRCVRARACVCVSIACWCVCRGTLARVYVCVGLPSCSLICTMACVTHQQTVPACCVSKVLHSKRGDYTTLCEAVVTPLAPNGSCMHPGWLFGYGCDASGRVGWQEQRH